MQEEDTDSTASRGDPPLKGLFYAQFDNEVGPQFVHVIPEGLLNESTIENVANYIFPKPELCGSLLTIRGTSKFKLMSCPLFIESSKYTRHRFTFAFGMVFFQEDDVGPYGPVLRKISRFFHKLEQESNFLSSGAHGKLGSLLLRILDDLLVRGECIVRVVDPKTFLALKLFPKPLDPPLFGDFQVPVLIKPLKKMVLKEWDLTIQRLEQHIDGKKFVKRIAIESGMDISIVRKALRQLLYYRVIIMIDVFQYSNYYCCTKKLIQLAENEALQRECRNEVIAVSTSMKNAPSFTVIFNLYASLHPAAPYGDFCVDHRTDLLGIDDQRLITFGIRYGLIRRIRNIPIPSTFPLPQLVSSENSMKGDTQSVTIRSLVDGARCFDDLCGITSFSFAEVNMMLNSMLDVTIVKI